MKNWFSSILAVFLIISATAAFGANKAGEFSLSPVMGGYALDKNQNLNKNLLYVYGLRAGYNFTKSLGLEALFDYSNTAKDKAGKGDVSMYRYGGEMLYHMWPDNRLVPYLAAGMAGINFDGNGINNRTRVAFDYGLGAKFFPTEVFALRGDVRHIIYDYNRTYNNIELTLGAYIPFGGTKPSVKPLEPQVQESSVPKAAPSAAVVLPAPPSINIAAVPASIQKGQTSKLTWDSKNATTCNIQPEIGTVETSGSMNVTPSANTDYTLTCSGAGGSATGGTNVAVTLPPPVKAVEPPPQAAAPKSSAAVRFCDKPAVLAISFDTNKAEIKPAYRNDLNKLVEFLKEFPKAKGEISGHTDNVGGKEFNNKLSQRRADSVKKYIVDTYKVDAKRITTKGYGFAKPVADNKTAAGKAKNRRIEANFSCE
ncbi:MAG: OmpA family protein [Deltaproteobacteria bacterium]|nr:OmpA family protein [Deltaproteobacteria bacterium]